ncbi:hypothetical protein ACX0G9_22380 [Flavitalea flava]
MRTNAIQGGLLIVSAGWLFGACIPTSLPVAEAAGGRQGIEGTVYIVSGNRMPSPDKKNSPLRAVRSTVYVYELTNISQVVSSGQSSYYSAIQTRLVKQADTDEKGRFSILLAPGKYSLFTKKGDLFYATRRDELNNISPVEVIPHKMTKVECRVESDHKAVY